MILNGKSFGLVVWEFESLKSRIPNIKLSYNSFKTDCYASNVLSVTQKLAGMNYNFSLGYLKLLEISFC